MVFSAFPAPLCEGRLFALFQIGPHRQLGWLLSCARIASLTGMVKSCIFKYSVDGRSHTSATPRMKTARDIRHTKGHRASMISGWKTKRLAQPGGSQANRFG